MTAKSLPVKLMNTFKATRTALKWRKNVHCEYSTQIPDRELTLSQARAYPEFGEALQVMREELTD